MSRGWYKIIKSSINFMVNQFWLDIEGRNVILDVQINGSRLRFINVYGDFHMYPKLQNR